MALSLLAANNAQTVLAAGISSTATSLTVNTGTGTLFPSPVTGTSFFKLTIIDAATGSLTEIVHVTARNGDVFTIQRGQEGTVARAWSANDIAANMMTAGTLSYILGNFQPLDPTLTALAALVGVANKLPYFNGNDTAALTDLTQVGRDIIGKSTIADILTYLGLTYFADRRSLALQDFAGPLSSKDSVTATSPDGTTRKISLNATNGLQIVIYDGGQYRGAINVPTKAGTMALTSDLVNFADKSSAAEQSFTGPVSSGEGLVAKYGAAKIILSAQNGQRIVVYTNDTYRGAINIPLRDGTMALLDDVTNVSATLLGISQSWQNVKANRTAGVTYTNSTSRPIAVSIAGIMASRQTGVQLSLAVNGTEASSFAVTDSSFDIRGNVFAIVPPGATYNLTASNINSILTWSELR